MKIPHEHQWVRVARLAWNADRTAVVWTARGYRCWYCSETRSEPSTSTGAQQ